MKFIHSFRTRLFTGFLAASLVPVLVCSSMLLQIFRLRLDSQVDEESQEYLSQVTESLDGLYTGFRQTMLALRASPYVAPALAREQTKSSRVYSELYSATEGSRSGAQFDLYDSQGTWLYSTRSVPPGTRLPTQWGVLYAARQPEDEAIPGLKKGDKSKYVLQAMDYIGAHYGEQTISVSTIAQHLGLSESHLSHLFRKETDYTIMNYLTRYRIHKAMELLRDCRLKVYEIAERVGYRDITYFSSTFKKVVGMSPSEFQDTCR